VAQIVAVLPIIPGGVGIVEGSLAVILVAYGALRIPAISAVLVYRIIAFWLAVLVGWLAFVGIVAMARRTSGRRATATAQRGQFGAAPESCGLSGDAGQ
jgi:hypothetical protein